MKEKEFENVLEKKSMSFKASFKLDDSKDDFAFITHNFKDFLTERSIQKKDKKDKRKIKKKKAL